MNIKNYKPSKGFIWALLLVIFTAWIVYKCVPLTEKKQDARIHSMMERQRMRLAQEFDRYTDKDLARLPKFDSRKYALMKRNGRFWLIPREYGDGGVGIKWPDTVNKLLRKKWKNETGEKNTFITVFMYSPQYYNRKADYISSDVACKTDTLRKIFKWNGIIINIYAIYAPNLTDDQYLDVCLTTLKILNEEIKEIHYVN